MEPQTSPGRETVTGPERLAEFELPWLARYEFLKERGYLLRPRYRPGWVPSWITDPSLRPIFCEDWFFLAHVGLLDAQRISDGLVVMLKEIDAKSTEGPITSLLSSQLLRSDPRNHAVPVLDVLVDNTNDQKSLLILPLLRVIDNPELESIPEALDLIEQTLEGEDRTTGFDGNERAPELSYTVPYDPYRLDIYILGKTYQEILLDEFINVEFLRPLIDRMTSLNPADRPSSAEAQAIFRDLRANLHLGWFNQRLRRTESGLVARTFKESSYWLQLRLARLSTKPMLPPLE
ncbi:hypothetical protein FRC01_000951 [Tulasnella sp. 417]|nr:hypothetical protein FRC01_000951 [Tulasnella sp. 417]